MGPQVIQCESDLADLESDEVIRSIGRGNTGDNQHLRSKFSNAGLVEIGIKPIGKHLGTVFF